MSQLRQTQIQPKLSDLTDDMWQKDIQIVFKESFDLDTASLEHTSSSQSSTSVQNPITTSVDIIHDSEDENVFLSL